jgi:hypothetical protein
MIYRCWERKENVVEFNNFYLFINFKKACGMEENRKNLERGWWKKSKESLVEYWKNREIGQ